MAEMGRRRLQPAWTLQYPVRPLTINLERNMSYWDRNRVMSETREWFGWQAKMIPAFDRIEVEACVVQSNGRHRMDLGNCLPSVKAAIDGLVDGGVIPDDDDKRLIRLCFTPTIIVPGEDGLRLVVVGHDEQERRWEPTRKRVEPRMKKRH